MQAASEYAATLRVASIRIINIIDSTNRNHPRGRIIPAEYKWTHSNAWMNMVVTNVHMQCITTLVTLTRTKGGNSGNHSLDEDTTTTLGGIPIRNRWIGNSCSIRTECNIPIVALCTNIYICTIANGWRRHTRVGDQRFQSWARFWCHRKARYP